MKRYLLFLLLLSSIWVFAQTKYVGGDISMLPKYEQHNSPYKDANGNNISDLITWCTTECGWNLFRVRIFVNPTNKNGDGVLQTTAYVAQLGQRIKDAGAAFMLDFHYSDDWVDATHIQPPIAWKGLSDSLMADTLGKYTAAVLDTLCAVGAMPDFVQVGNEIMHGLCDITVHPYQQANDNWTGYAGLLKAGCNAVRQHCPSAKIIIHTDRPTNTAYNKFFYQKLIDMGVDYDIIGLSYYPFWHGYLTTEQVAQKQDKNCLCKALNQLANDFPNKQVQIVETAYNFQYWPTSGVNYDTQDVWSCSVEGQYNCMRDLIAELQHHTNVTGLCYWFPEEAGNGDDTNWSTSKGTVLRSWLNRGLWDEKASQTGHALNALSDKSNVPQLLGTYLISTATDVMSVIAPAQKQFVNGQLYILYRNTYYNCLGLPL